MFYKFILLVFTRCDIFYEKELEPDDHNLSKLNLFLNTDQTVWPE